MINMKNVNKIRRHSKDYIWKEEDEMLNDFEDLKDIIYTE